jgi:hypothetical protein
VIGGSTHLTILGVTLLFNRIGIYFFFSLVLANIWFAVLALIQTVINGSLKINPINS